MKQALGDKTAEWLEQVKHEGAESAIKEAERIVDFKTGTIDIAGKKMKTPHPGANLKWMKPEDYVEQLQKSFLAKRRRASRQVSEKMMSSFPLLPGLTKEMEKRTDLVETEIALATLPIASIAPRWIN